MDRIDVEGCNKNYFVSDGWLVVGIGIQNVVYVCRVSDIGKLSMCDLYEILPRYKKNIRQLLDEMVKDLYSLVWYGPYLFIKWQVLQPDGTVPPTKEINGLCYSLTGNKPKSNKASICYKKDDCRVRYFVPDLIKRKRSNQILRQW